MLDGEATVLRPDAASELFHWRVSNSAEPRHALARTRVAQSPNFVACRSSGCLSPGLNQRECKPEAVFSTKSAFDLVAPLCKQVRRDDPAERSWLERFGELEWKLEIGIGLLPVSWTPRLGVS